MAEGEGGAGIGSGGGQIIAAGAKPNLPSGAMHEGTALTSVKVDGPYDPGDLILIDRAIRHMPEIVKYQVQKCQEMLQRTGAPEEFAVVLQNWPDTDRPRAYGAPNTSDGIHLELSEGVLLKAAVSMEGQ